MKVLQAIFLSTIILLLSACSAPLTIKESSVIRTDVQKAKSLQLVYVDATMRVASQENWGRPVSTGNTEFGVFGERVVKQAAPVFSKRGISLVSATVQDDKKPLQLAAPVGHGGQQVPLLIITPTYGKITGNGHATAANYVFVASLVDVIGKPVLWKASIDTNAWVGQDFVMKNFSGTKYDEVFAEQFLNMIADQMQKDGVL